MTIPNIIHFIYPCHGTRPLSFLNYMAVKLAKDKQNPDSIFFWIDGEPVDSPWWPEIKSLVEVRTFSPVTEFRNTPTRWPQYASDVFRLQLLYDYGGIYLDTDMLLLSPLTDFMNSPFERLIMSYEPTKKRTPESICNALIISEPKNDFVAAWLDRMPVALNSEVWAHGGVQIPFILHKEHPSLGNHSIKSDEAFCPLDLSQNWLFSSDAMVIREAEILTSFSYSIHGFETYWRDIVKDITPEWCEKHDSLFSRIVEDSQ